VTAVAGQHGPLRGWTSDTRLHTCPDSVAARPNQAAAQRLTPGSCRRRRRSPRRCD
jgi:hypothetical protein